MGEAVLLLLLLLLVISVQVQAQAQEELSKEDILCIRQSRQETALGRWLECMQPHSLKEFQDPQPELLSSDEKGAQEQSPTMDKENPEIEQLTVNEGEFLAEDELQAGDGLLDTGRRDRASAAVHTYFEDGEEVNSSHFLTGEMRATKEDAQEQPTTDKENPQPEQFVANKGEFDSSPVSMHYKDGEEASSDHLQTVEMRVVEEDALLGWLKLNLGLLALGKLSFELAKTCSWKKVGKKSSESSIMYLAEDSIEAAPEVSKTVIVDDTPSRKHSETAYFPMLGSSLGSAVGAVFAEVLLKTCSSRSSVPTDKINMLLESALEELSTLVQGDDGCSRLVGDFVSSFKSTYATMYRIHQACTSYGASRETNSHLQRDNSSSILKPTCENQCTSTKSNGEIIHSPGTDPSDDTRQVKQGLPPRSSDDNIKLVKLESRSRLTVDSFLEQRECSSPLGEIDSTVLTASAVENHDFKAPIEFKHIQKSEVCYERNEIPSCVGNNNELEETSFITREKFEEKGATELGYEVDDASSVCEEHTSLMQSGRLDALALMGQGYGAVGSKLQKDFLKFYERHVVAQEQHNQIKFVELKQLMKQQMLEEEKIQLTYTANGLMRENIELSRSKANFRETRILEKQAKAAYMSFCTTCADELAAGLFVMLISLVYSVRKYSFALLNDLVSTCQPSVKEPRRSLGFHIDWFYNSLDLLAGKLQAFVCHVTLTGRILIGSILVVIVAWSLLRRSVTSSSQAMPATILIIVLGGVCGFVGKVSVDSLGGCGNRWWVVWGAFCLMHALTNCLTSSVHRLLHGSPTSRKARFGLPFWIRRLAFHCTLVLVLPVLAGLLPFGSFSLVMNDLFQTLVEIAASVFSSFTEWSAQLV